MLQLVLSVILVSTIGCASVNKQLKSFLGGKKEKAGPTLKSTAPKKNGKMFFSQQPDMQFNNKRKYRKMTKGKFENQARISGDSGSLWSMEGQGAYLFSQNQSRRVGDLLNVKLVGAAREQLETKVNVIKRLLRKMEREKLSRRQLAAIKKKKEKEKEKGSKEETPEEDVPQNTPRGKNVPDEGGLQVKTVPTRIVEKLADGNYRVKGSQAFMIGKREYKVIVTGIVRSEDFNDEGIISDKILDPRYDIVSNRRSFAE